MIELLDWINLWKENEERNDCFIIFRIFKSVFILEVFISLSFYFVSFIYLCLYVMYYVNFLHLRHLRDLKKAYQITSFLSALIFMTFFSSFNHSLKDVCSYLSIWVFSVKTWGMIWDKKGTNEGQAAFY